MDKMNILKNFWTPQAFSSSSIRSNLMYASEFGKFLETLISAFRQLGHQNTISTFFRFQNFFKVIEFQFLYMCHIHLEVTSTQNGHCLNKPGLEYFTRLAKIRKKVQFCLKGKIQHFLKIFQKITASKE